MKDLTSTQPMTDAEYEAEVDRMIAQMQERQREIKASRARIEQTRIQTRAMLDDIRTVVGRLRSN